ncbi:DNA ligase 1-like [Vespula maculifrons]|uniref:DNA ligase 1-like n=1 Tax=Vespula maculifrons TaxID=7453 RepID=A0ABD2AW51_VESMC
MKFSEFRRDYSVSGLFANELESEKRDTEWLANHQAELLKENYVSRRRKSRSTLEENSEGEETEETNPKIRRKWKPRRKRKFKRSLFGAIKGATSSFINTTKDISNMVVNESAKEANMILESLKEESPIKKEENNVSINATDLEQENATPKNVIEQNVTQENEKMKLEKADEKKEKTLELSTLHVPTDISVTTETPKYNIGSDFVTLIKKFFKEIMDRIDNQLQYQRKQMGNEQKETVPQEEKEQSKKEEDVKNVRKQERKKGEENEENEEKEKDKKKEVKDTKKKKKKEDDTEENEEEEEEEEEEEKDEGEEGEEKKEKKEMKDTKKKKKKEEGTEKNEENEEDEEEEEKGEKGEEKKEVKNTKKKKKKEEEDTKENEEEEEEEEKGEKGEEKKELKNTKKKKKEEDTKGNEREKENEKEDEEKDEKKNDKKSKRKKKKKEEVDEDEEEEEKEEDKKKKEKGKRREKNEKKRKGKEENEDNEDDLKKSKNDGSVLSSSDIKWFKIIPDVPSPIEIKNIIDDKIFPWKTLTTKQYIKEVLNQDGSNNKHTTKEKFKLNFFYMKNPSKQQTDDKEKLQNSLNLYGLKKKLENHEEDNESKLCELIKQDIDEFQKNDINENAIVDYVITLN